MPVHWLSGGALTLQTPGSSSALVWLMAMPKDVAVPSRTMQRQRGSVCTTPASTEQQEIPGSDALLEMKSMHGARVIITLEQPLPCAAALETKASAASASASRLVVVTEAEADPIVRAALVDRCRLHEAMLRTLDMARLRVVAVRALNEKRARGNIAVVRSCIVGTLLLPGRRHAHALPGAAQVVGHGGESWWPSLAASYLWKINGRVLVAQSSSQADPATRFFLGSFLALGWWLLILRIYTRSIGARCAPYGSALKLQRNEKHKYHNTLSLLQL
jgi:hypothetical protein